MNETKGLGDCAEVAEVAEIAGDFAERKIAGDVDVAGVKYPQGQEGERARERNKSATNPGHNN